MSTELTTLSAISKALAEISTVPEAKDLRDKAAAIARYAKESRQSLQVQNQACFVKLMCERKAGLLLSEVPRAPPNKRGQGRNGKNKSTAGVAGDFSAMLRDAKIPESTARLWQAYAQVPEERLLALLNDCNADEDELTSSLAVNVARWHLGKAKAQKKAQATTTAKAQATTTAKAPAAPARRQPDENAPAIEDENAPTPYSWLVVLLEEGALEPKDVASTLIIGEEVEEALSDNDPSKLLWLIQNLIEVYAKRCGDDAVQTDIVSWIEEGHCEVADAEDSMDMDASKDSTPERVHVDPDPPTAVQ
jgi:hypothetical protein